MRGEKPVQSVRGQEPVRGEETVRESVQPVWGEDCVPESVRGQEPVRGQPVRAQEVDVIPRRANRPEGRLSTNAAVFGPERLLFDRLIAIL